MVSVPSERIEKSMMASDIFLIIILVCLFILSTLSLVEGIQLIKKSYKNKEPPINRTDENCVAEGIMLISFAIIIFFLIFWRISLSAT